jgi:hypothetical protein
MCSDVPVIDEGISIANSIIILRCRLYSALLICSLFLIKQVFSQSRYEKRFISNVSQSRLQQVVRDLVKIGNRLGGTKSGHKAALYVSAKFKSYGFAPEILKEPEKPTYTNIDWQLKVEKPRRLRGLIQHEWLAGFSPSVKTDTARLLFIKSADDIDEDKIKGSAVLLTEPPSENLYEELSDAGVKCILCYQLKITSAYSNWAMISSLDATRKNTVAVYDISNIAGNRLRSELQKGTEIVIKYSAKTEVKPGRPETVVATLKGATNEYYIVCAHGDSDSGGPGADDNASGVSGVLEIARILNSLVRSGRMPLPHASIKFIVWGSECYSSSHYIKENQEELKNIRGVINIDEIGIGKSRNCIYFEGNDIPHNHDLLKLFEQVGEDYVGRKGFWKEATTNPCQEGTTSNSVISFIRNFFVPNRFQGSTDSYVFLPKYLDELDVPEIEIPSVTVFTAAWNKPNTIPQTRGWFSKAWRGHPDSVVIDYSPFYHSSLDIPIFTTDKEPANMVWGVNASGIVLIRLLWQ